MTGFIRIVGGETAQTERKRPCLIAMDTSPGSPVGWTPTNPTRPPPLASTRSCSGSDGSAQHSVRCINGSRFRGNRDRLGLLARPQHHIDANGLSHFHLHVVKFSAGRKPLASARTVYAPGITLIATYTPVLSVTKTREIPLATSVTVTVAPAMRAAGLIEYLTLNVALNGLRKEARTDQAKYQRHPKQPQTTIHISTCYSGKEHTTSLATR